MDGFTDTLTSGQNPNGTLGANFGHALCKVGDLNGDGIPDLMTGANQQNEGWAYILYLNPDKTVKTFTRINNSESGFNLTLDSEERFSRSISFVGVLRGDGTIAVNYGGGAGGTGSLYLMFFKPCDFTQESGFNRWSGGTILFSNWNHNSQSLTGDSLNFEQCTFKSFETDAPYINYNFNDGRCICMDSTAVLINSLELSTAFTNECFSNFLSTRFVNQNDIVQVTVYPNPATSRLIIKSNQTFHSNQDKIQVYSILGKRLYDSYITAQETILNFSNFSKGSYILCTSINGVEKRFKILKR